MATNATAFKERTKQLAVRVIRVVDSLPRKRASTVIGNQVLRSATSVGANYRAACRSRSKKEFAAKLGIVEEEADETLYWLELLMAAEIVKPVLLLPLIDETNQILAMVVSSLRTVKYNSDATKPSTQHKNQSP